MKSSTCGNSPGSSCTRPLIRRSNNDAQDDCLLEECGSESNRHESNDQRVNEHGEKVGVIISVKPFNPRKINLWGGSKKDRISLGMNEPISPSISLYIHAISLCLHLNP